MKTPTPKWSVSYIMSVPVVLKSSGYLDLRLIFDGPWKSEDTYFTNSESEQNRENLQFSLLIVT